jgi:hypothetical protein
MLPRSCARWRAHKKSVVVSATVASAVSPPDVVLVDLQGHAYLAYLVEAGQTKVFVIRPDGVIEAIIHDAESVKIREYSWMCGGLFLDTVINGFVITRREHSP